MVYIRTAFQHSGTRMGAYKLRVPFLLTTNLGEKLGFSVKSRLDCPRYLGPQDNAIIWVFSQALNKTALHALPRLWRRHFKMNGEMSDLSLVIIYRGYTRYENM
jgi:hypothetical protein